MINTYKRLRHLLDAGVGKLTVLICALLVLGACEQLDKASTPVQTSSIEDSSEQTGLTVTFKSKGETLHTQKIKNGDFIPFPNISKQGFYLDGWYTDESCTKKWDFTADTVSSSIVLYAKQMQTGDRKVTFMNEGEVLYITWAKYLETMPEPEIVKRNYILDGWYQDLDCTMKWNFKTDNFVQHTVLYAKGEKTDDFVVRFVSEDKLIMKTEPLKKGSKITAPDEDEVREKSGMDSSIDFLGWNYRDYYIIDAWNFETNTVDKDITLYADWTGEKTLEAPKVTVKAGEACILFTGEPVDYANTYYLEYKKPDDAAFTKIPIESRYILEDDAAKQVPWIFVLTGLTPDTEYTYKVTASRKNSIGNVEYEASSVTGTCTPVAKQDHSGSEVFTEYYGYEGAGALMIMDANKLPEKRYPGNFTVTLNADGSIKLYAAITPGAMPYPVIYQTITSHAEPAWVDGSCYLKGGKVEVCVDTFENGIIDEDAFDFFIGEGSCIKETVNAMGKPCKLLTIGYCPKRKVDGKKVFIDFFFGETY